MGKTNDYRACELVAVWRYKHGAMVVDGVLDDLRSEVTKALDKEHKRGRREERKKATSEVCIFCPGLKNGECPHVQCDSQPVYTVDKAVKLANALIDAMNDENALKIFNAKHDIIDAITGSAKREPQFDTEKVRGLINALRDKEFELGNVFEMKDRREYLALGNSVVDAERALLAALDINDK